VVDRFTGDILLPFCTNPARDQYDRRVFVARSVDDGETWSAPVEITDAVSLPEWTWYATGPGRSIQLTSGRFVVPCTIATPSPARLKSHYLQRRTRNLQNRGRFPAPTPHERRLCNRRTHLLLNMRDLSSATGAGFAPVT
jgi:sialidase-1